MSKRALKQYLNELSKAELEEQIFELYGRLKEVKEFYDFVFNPNEEKKMEEAKFKIAKEYFPIGKRKAKKRRSVAQNQIKEFIKLGVNPQLIGDLMLYNIEIAQTYNNENPITSDAFYKSMLKSFKEAVDYIDKNGLESAFNQRLDRLVDEVDRQNWINKIAFEKILQERF